MVYGSFDESKERRLLFGVYASAFKISDCNDLKVLQEVLDVHAGIRQSEEGNTADSE
jgi:hypothetical protein